MFFLSCFLLDIASDSDNAIVTAASILPRMFSYSWFIETLYNVSWSLLIQNESVVSRKNILFALWLLIRIASNHSSHKQSFSFYITLSYLYVNKFSE